MPNNIALQDGFVPPLCRTSTPPNRHRQEYPDRNNRFCLTRLLHQHDCRRRLPDKAVARGRSLFFVRWPGYKQDFLFTHISPISKVFSLFLFDYILSNTLVFFSLKVDSLNIYFLSNLDIFYSLFQGNLLIRETFHQFLKY